jgi:tetratricopeptide (TPR) repeat protein
MFQGVLYCIQCSKRAEEARLETLAFKQSLAAGTFYECARCAAPVPLADIRSGAVVYYLGELACRGCSKDLRGILGPREPSLPSQRLPALTRERPSQVLEIPPDSCGLCRGPVSKRSIQEGRALVHEGQNYCASCRPEVEKVLDISRLSCERLIAFTCTTCSSAIPPEDLLEDKALRYKGALYCRACAKGMHGKRPEVQNSQSSQIGFDDDGRPPVPPPAPKRVVGGGTRLMVTAVPLSVPCARCERMIAAMDVRSGKAAEVGGKLYCHRCKGDFDAAKHKIEKRIAKSLVCAHCGRSISAKEVNDKKVAYTEGNIYCATCSKDPGILLRGTASSAEVDVSDEVCATCGATIPKGGSCAVCAAKLEKIQEGSAAAASELGSLLEAVPCEGEDCKKSITIDDLEHGRAEIVGIKTLCAECADREHAKLKRKRGARCARCNKLLPDNTSHVPGALCGECMTISEHDAEDDAVALTLSSEIRLCCDKCERVLSPDELKTRQAESVGGKLLCRDCKGRAKVVTAPRPSMATKPCITCDQAIKGEPFLYSGKSFCLQCKLEVEGLLKQGAAVPAGSPCTACKKPAAAGSILIEEKVFCGACKKAADYFLLYTVRQRRSTKPRKAPRVKPGKRSLAFVGVAAFGVLAFFTLPQLLPDRPKGGGGGGGPESHTLKQDSAAELALQVAAAAIGRPPAGLDQARSILQSVQAQAEKIRGDQKCEPEFEKILDQATRWRDEFAPGQASRLIDLASSMFNKAKKPEEAVAVLNGFPKDLEQTEAFAKVAKERDRWSALARCMSKANQLLAIPEPGGHTDMAQLLASSDAIKCEFSKTDLGKNLDLVRQRRRDAVERMNDPKLAEAHEKSEEARGRGDRAVDKLELDKAESAYREALGWEADSDFAYFGLCRCALERERVDRLKEAWQRAGPLGGTLPAKLVIEAWLYHVEGDDERARATLDRVLPASLGKLGKRLKALLDKGFLAFPGEKVRIYTADGVKKVTADERMTILQTRARYISAALSLQGLEQLDLYLFPDEPARADFVSKLGTRPGANGHLPGCFAIALVGPSEETLARAIATALVARVEPGTVPPWLLAAVPDEIARPANSSFPGKVTLDQLEKLKDVAAVQADEEKLASARGYAALIHSDEGAAELARYVRAFYKARENGEDPKKAQEARTALERAVARLVKKAS